MRGLRSKAQPQDAAAVANARNPTEKFVVRPRLICLFLVAVTLLVFWPVTGFDFVNYDDGDYFSGNRHILAGLNLKAVTWAFSTGHAANWHPVTWLSLMLDAELFGPSPTGPHVMNVLYHLANTVLLFLLMQTLTGATWESGVVAGLFALHPLHVESVAWISERKDVLSTFFGLLALCAYAHYVTAAEAGGRAGTVTRTETPLGNIPDTREVLVPPGETLGPTPLRLRPRAHYFLALIFFALGLMSKPMLVTLPFVMLLLDYWPLNRVHGRSAVHGSKGLNRLIWEKMPFLLLSAGACAVTLIVQAKGGAVRNLATLPLDARVANALVSYARYLGETLWPFNLAALYPHPGHWPWEAVLLAAILVGSLCVGAFLWRQRWPFLFVGWFWFFGTLMPVIGLVQVGIQSMADRYTYMPLIGIFVITVWGARKALLYASFPNVLFLGGAALLLTACAARTRDQLGYWRNGEALFRHAVAVTKNNRSALAFLHNDLGASLYRQGRIAEAIQNYQKAVELDPGYDLAQNNLGIALASQGRYEDAINHYNEALRSHPDYVNAQINLADALMATGRTDEAIVYYRTALANEPEAVAALNNLGLALMSKGRYEEAISQFEKVIELSPRFAGGRRNLGKALSQQGRMEDAVTNYLVALQIDPDSPETHCLLGIARASQQRKAEAVAQFNEALRLRPGYSEAAQRLHVLTNTTP